MNPTLVIMRLTPLNKRFKLLVYKKIKESIERLWRMQNSQRMCS